MEAAEIECRRRDKRCRSDVRGQELNRVVQWRGRAQQAREMAHQFKQAVVEAVELLDAALHGWRLQDLYREIDEEPAVLENHHSVLNATLPCASTCVIDV